MTTAQLNLLLVKWQTRLVPLKDWRITAKFVKSSELWADKQFANISYSKLSPQWAEIKILNPREMRKLYSKSPIESTLVHELAHLLLPDVTKENKDEIELLADQWTQILLSAYNEWEQG